jgi:hypothetical protein
MLALFATEPNELLRRAALSAALAVLGGLSAFVYRQYLMPFQFVGKKRRNSELDDP